MKYLALYVKTLPSCSKEGVHCLVDAYKIVRFILVACQCDILTFVFNTHFTVYMYD